MFGRKISASMRVNKKILIHYCALDLLNPRSFLVLYLERLHPVVVTVRRVLQ